MAQTLYAVVYLASATDPADDATGHGQIKDGKDGSGATAVWSGNATWTGSGQQLTATGLSAGTLYALAAVVYDDVALTYSNRVLGTEFYTQSNTTLSATGGTGALSLVASSNPSVALAATGESGTLSAEASVPASATLAQTGETGTLSASASSPATTALAATGASGTLNLTASTVATATLASTGGTGELSASAYTPATAVFGAAGASGTLAVIAYTPAQVSLALEGGTGTLLASASVVSETAGVQGNLSFAWPTRRERKRKKPEAKPPEPTLREQIHEELEAQFEEAAQPPAVDAVPEDSDAPETAEEETREDAFESPEEPVERGAGDADDREVVAPVREGESESEARFAAQLIALDALISRLEAHEQSLIRSRRRFAQQRLLLM